MEYIDNEALMRNGNRLAGACLGTAVPKWLWDPCTGAKLGLSVEGRKWCFLFGLGFPKWVRLGVHA
jgi:hypothetical protein